MVKANAISHFFNIGQWYYGLIGFGCGTGLKTGPGFTGLIA
jgi:hypothetical protein